MMIIIIIKIIIIIITLRTMFMVQVISRVHRLHRTNVEQHKVAAHPRPSQTFIITKFKTVQSQSYETDSDCYIM